MGEPRAGGKMPKLINHLHVPGYPSSGKGKTLPWIAWLLYKGLSRVLREPTWGKAFSEQISAVFAKEGAVHRETWRAAMEQR